MLTWILVCDASSGRIFKTPGPIQKIALIHQFDHPQSRNKGTDLVSDRPGSAAGVHGGVGQQANPKEVEAEHFAKEVAHYLNKGHSENAYAHLVLVAPPHFLGLIRENINKSASKVLSQSLDKDFVKLKEHDLIQSLEKYMR